MKYIIAILLATNVAIAATTPQDAKQVYERLIRANHIKNAPPLYVIEDDDPNAYSSLNEIGINTGMLKFATNDDELARILGHELAHLKLHHHRSSVKNEYAADRMAAIYMSTAGYNVCRGALLLKRRGSNGGNDHPADILRYKAFHCNS